MTVNVSKPAFNIREKVSELDKPTGLKGTELMRSETSQEARDLIGAGRKNKIINGAMLVSQRRLGATHTDSNGFHTDRFRTQVSGMDQLVQTYDQDTDAPTGFSKSLKITTTTPETSITASSEYLALYQKIEGQNLQDFAYGTGSAKTITVSFYVKSSITGQFGYTIYRNESTDRVINKFYTINNANTWERKTITVEGDTAATIGNSWLDNWWNCWHLAASPGYMSAETKVWANYSSGTNWAGFHKQNGVVTTNGATWQITGVQIEIGENATEFEHRSFSEELALCWRYYIQYGSSVSGSPGLGRFPMMGECTAVGVAQYPLQFPVAMRGGGTVTLYSNGSSTDYQIYSANQSKPASGITLADTFDNGTGNIWGVRLNLNRSSNDLTVGRAAQAYASATNFLGFGREL